MGPAMAARYGLEQGWVGAQGTRCFAFDDQPDFHPAPLHLDRDEAGDRQVGRVSGIERFRDQSREIQRHSDAASLQLNSIDQSAEVVRDVRAMRELIACPLSSIERRLQISNRHARVLQVSGDRGLVSEHLPSGACNRALDLERWSGLRRTRASTGGRDSLSGGDRADPE